MFNDQDRNDAIKTGAVLGGALGLGLLFQPTRSVMIGGARALGGFAAREASSLGRSIVRDAPGMVTRGLNSATTIGSWVMGGDPRFLNWDRGHMMFNPSLRNKILGGAALWGGLTTMNLAYKRRINSYQTDYDTMESRHTRDLGATGSLPISMSSNLTQALKRTWIHLF